MLHTHGGDGVITTSTLRVQAVCLGQRTAASTKVRTMGSVSGWADLPARSPSLALDALESMQGSMRPSVLAASRCLD